MSSQDAAESDTGIRISVVPAQSAFFAGEDFKVTVTFTNTRSPTAPAKRTVSHTHKRAVHSVSYAPLARPPTSPVTPRPIIPPTPVTARPEEKDKKNYTRKGLIGNDTLKPGDKSKASESWRGKSMSVSISTHELAAALSATVASSLRDPSFPVNHPHARKHSLLDGQTQAELQLRELSSSPILAPSGSGSVNNSAFSLSLDTIAEGNSQPETHSYPPVKNRPPNIGLGIGPPPALLDPRQPPRSAFATTFTQPGTELVLYAYSQLSGSLTLGSVQGESRVQSQALNAVRSALKKRQAVGGGSMEISSTLDGRPNDSPVLQRTRSGHARSASLSSSLINLLSPPPVQHQPWNPGHKARSPSLLASLITPSVSSPASFSGSGLEVIEEIDPNTPLPIYDVQPSVLAVDLVLAPGESRSYTYTLPLPNYLPPTFRGRTIKFAYHLTVGVCRASTSPSVPASTGKGSTSQIMRVPIRVYNNVNVTSPYPQKPYDLLSPVLNVLSKNQNALVVEVLRDGSPVVKSKPPKIEVTSANNGRDPNSKSGLGDYAHRLLMSLSETVDRPMTTDTDPVSPSAYRELEGGAGELTGCREAVEILTRNMRKISYDVNKDGVKVAVLTFTKSAYRLGETVNGVVEINELNSRARVLKLSAMLEAHETLPSTLSPPSSQDQGQMPKKFRKLHAEYHTALTPSILRTSFALDIPSDASPAFQCECASPFPFSGSGRELNTVGSGEKKQVPGGLAWTVRLCLLVAVTSPYATTGTTGARTKGLIRDGPQGEWGSTWRATRGISPLQKIDAKAQRRAQRSQQHQILGGGGASPGQNQQQRGWASYLLSSLLSPGEREYHDGDEEEEDDDDYDEEAYERKIKNRVFGSGAGLGIGVGEDVLDETRVNRDLTSEELDIGGGDEGWGELRAEMVECEIPIRVWPGNTAFRPMEVVFDV